MALSAKRPSRADTTKERLMREVKEAGERRKRLNVEIEASLYQKIKLKSVEEGCNISDITRQLWIEYLSK